MVGLTPGLGPVYRIVLAHCSGHASRLRLVWECLFLLVLLKMPLVVGAGFSDDICHIPWGEHHGRCARAMTRGFEMRVLEAANARWMTGSGC